MEIKQVPASSVVELRAKILRPGQPLAASHYPLDHLGIHLGAFANGQLVSVVTAHPEQHPDFPERNQWRIRGMATDLPHQGKGIGRDLLQKLLVWGRQQKIPLYWCNARVPAIPFYERSGFTVESGVFELPLIGPHKMMKFRP